MSGVATPSAPIAGSAYVLATKPTCYMYGPSLSITDRSVDMYTVHSFKNKLNLAS